LQGDELRALRRLHKEQEPRSAFVFTSERGAPMGRFNVNKMVAKAGEIAGICWPTRRLQLWMGHSDIKHTARYSELSTKPFRDFWR
jgi:type 1 fimbriae regulatory protein FimB/type 1 fimbriae regulatory protein FimE